MFDIAQISGSKSTKARSGSGDTTVELEEFQQMVDGMPVNVMTLELENFTIDYANKTSVDTLTPLEHLLPCKAAAVVGQCVDFFHKNPEHQRRILSDPSNLPY